jgi:SAM-dependent methyltransferase
VVRARATAQAEGVGNVSFTVADAQVHDFPPASVDVAVSRFGVMFFADPVAAFANIGRALAPGGRLAFACWQDEAANDWLRIPAEVLAEHVGHTEPVPGAPGAVSLADPEQVRAMLGAAGFTGVALADAPAPMWLGADAAEAYERVATSGMTRAALEGKDPAAVSAALDALRAAVAGLDRGKGVSVPARAWLVTAGRA